MIEDSRSATLSWVVLTQGNRPVEVGAAVESLLADDSDADIVVVINAPSGTEVPLPDDDRVRVLEAGENLGAPGGRHLGVLHCGSDVIGFLDDDATVASAGVGDAVRSAFTDDDRVGAIAFRIVDSDGVTDRRHNPRIGRTGGDKHGEVTTFLEGACAIRRSAYHSAGGYWTELFYAHESLDLAWRLRDSGHRVVYRPDVVVHHPRVGISRHPDGWFRTGRNRVLVARRNLPWPIAAVHVVAWLIVGAWRAPDRACRADYLRGWRRGWRHPVPRRPIRWRTVVALSRIGRPPLI